MNPACIIEHGQRTDWMHCLEPLASLGRFHKQSHTASQVLTGRSIEVSTSRLAEASSGWVAVKQRGSRGKKIFAAGWRFFFSLRVARSFASLLN